MIPSVENYGKYSSENYGAHTLCFTDERGYDFYFSYRTCVAFRTPDTGLIVRQNDWGPTTGKHLNWIDGGGEALQLRVDSFTFETSLVELGGVNV